MGTRRVELNRTYISTRGNMREITPLEERSSVPGEYLCHIIEPIDVDENGNDVVKEYDDFLTAYDILH